MDYTIKRFLFNRVELVLRDVMHESLSKTKMLIIVVIAGIISFLINAESKNIAIASFAAIVVSCLVDYYVYSKTKGTWKKEVIRVISLVVLLIP